jgi:hypothetical protein
MTKAVIEIVKGDNGKPQYAVVKSGDPQIDKLTEIAIGTMGAYIKSGGNVQNLLGGMGNGLNTLLQQGMGGLFKGF